MFIQEKNILEWLWNKNIFKQNKAKKICLLLSDFQQKTDWKTFSKLWSHSGELFQWLFVQHSSHYIKGMTTLFLTGKKATWKK